MKKIIILLISIFSFLGIAYAEEGFIGDYEDALEYTKYAVTFRVDSNSMDTYGNFNVSVGNDKSGILSKANGYVMTFADVEYGQDFSYSVSFVDPTYNNKFIIEPYETIKEDTITVIIKVKSYTKKVLYENGTSTVVVDTSDTNTTTTKAYSNTETDSSTQLEGDTKNMVFNIMFISLGIIIVVAVVVAVVKIQKANQ